MEGGSWQLNQIGSQSKKPERLCYNINVLFSEISEEIATMNEVGFRKFLQRGGPSARPIGHCIRRRAEFQICLDEVYPGTSIDEAAPEMLENYFSLVESEPKTSVKNHL